MCKMSTIEKKVKELKKLKAHRDELDAEISKLEQWLKDEMTSRNEYVIEGAGWKVTWNTVSSSRFDQSLFKKDHPDTFSMYQRVSESRRFLLS